MDTSSSFYQHMRQSYNGDQPVPSSAGNAYGGGGVNAGGPSTSFSTSAGGAGFAGGTSATQQHGGPVPINDIRSRLNQIVSRSGSANAQPLQPTTAQAAMRGTSPSGGVVDSATSPIPSSAVGHQGGGPSSTSMATSPMPTGIPAGVTPQPIVPAGAEMEDILTQKEMECLRVIELDGTVAVYASVPQQQQQGSGQLPNSTSLQLLCDQAIVKVFPRHVVMARSVNGSPVVELVIQELCELSEDINRQALTFVLAKPTGNAVVELTSSRPQILTALYKLVCMKRNLIESSGGLQQPKQ